MAKVISAVRSKRCRRPSGGIFRRAYVWQVPVRLTHGQRALRHRAFPDGLYIASPSSLPAASRAPLRHGPIRQIHFAAGIIFVISFLVRIYWFWAGNNYARSGFPFVWRPVGGAIFSARPPTI